MLQYVKGLTLTTDCWTSSTAENYLAVTAHFIDGEFVLRHVVLGCEVFGERHTSQNLAAAIKKIILEWNLENKINIIISDNAANIKKAIQDELRFKHFGCYAHTINLIAQDALKPSLPVLSKVKDIVSYFRRSTHAANKLCEQQQNLEMEPTKRLIQEVPTRWNSTFYMVERFVALEEAVRTTMALISHDLPVISMEEWDFLKELIIVLRPLEEITKTMSGENYLTGSLVIILTDGLTDVYRDLCDKQFKDMSKSIIKAVLHGIITRLGDLEGSNSLTLTTFLDPRFKNVAFSNDSVTDRVKHLLISSLTANIKKNAPPLMNEENKDNGRINPDVEEKKEPQPSI
ncbi:hypothetical protein PPYR_04880 [Photinus pyralis]|uniref:Uncharacterized protein n=1 Tax=Photinus pyralis TaxID=7054 RepID=A0A5N4AZD6_PHOPY|nr:hypothetical protein PPYR_15389 [Photinus pyralis]KAB0802694.1 hypothetical protein PPYR_04880 [Photinus pyralis]